MGARLHMEARLPALILAAVVAMMFTAPAGLAAEGGRAVDVKIILAVDASGSVGRGEFHLQIDGIAAALRSPELQAAVRAGPEGRVLAALLIWSDAAYPKYPTAWHLLETPRGFDDFAREIEAFKQQAPGVPAIGGGGTGIGDALVFALTMLEREPTPARRLVVDVSGDGPESEPWVPGAARLPEARALARRRGVVVNGLAIENEHPGLLLWYRENLITGPGSFAMRATDYSDFRRAILKKLLRELSQGPVAALVRAYESRGDCRRTC